MIKQFVSQDNCLNCRVCCRFPEQTSELRPFFCPQEIMPALKMGVNFTSLPHIEKITHKHGGIKIGVVPYSEAYICPLFSPEKNICRGYEARPFDCRLYPFILTFNEGHNRVLLSIDIKCRFTREQLGSPAFAEYAGYLSGILESDKISEMICANPGLIAEPHQDLIPQAELSSISKNVCLSHFDFRRLSLEDQTLFNEYLPAQNPALSSSSFASIFVWSGLLNFTWKLINDFLCVIAESGGEYFLYMPPLSKDRSDSKDVTVEIIEILRELNSGGSATRIENTPDDKLSFFTSLGFKALPGYNEYICLQKNLAELSGNRLKGKRSAANFFAKNYAYSIYPFQIEDTAGCLNLFRKWAEGGILKNRGEFYQKLLADQLHAHYNGMQYYNQLGLKGLVLRVNDDIIGYTFGFELNKETFCVLFETVDLSFKGAPAFLSQKFSQAMNRYKYINLMDDSGLANLKKHKLSYHPAKVSPVHTIIPTL
ncbi:MAG: DUF2156 domain-containing protein [Candidatus Omnitrophica bacterium]|nr:DUF2156 domain-containing protein [Candidatus Omnitrophota bacterium]